MNIGGTGNSGTSQQYMAAYIGQSFHAFPHISSGTLSTFGLANRPLPAGLAFDLVTGEISGILTAPAGGRTFRIYP
jgi:hypothetical protein